MQIYLIFSEFTDKDHAKEKTVNLKELENLANCRNPQKEGIW